MTRILAILIFSVFALAMSQPPDDYIEPAPEPTPEEPAPEPEPTPPPAFTGLDFRSTTGSNVTEYPANTFAIPRCGDGKLGYVVATWPTEPLLGAAMRIEYTMTMSADAVIVDNEDRTKTPGIMFLYMQKDGFTYYSDSYNKGERQWSIPGQKLISGPNTFEVPLTYDKWTGGGTNSEYYFKRTMNDIGGVGFTLAGYGGSSRGHGVCMAAGTAKLTITNFVIR